MEKAKGQQAAEGRQLKHESAARENRPATPSPEHDGLSREERFEILKIEIALLQSRFDKFDGLVFQMRGWLITIVAGLLGAALTLKKGPLTLLSLAVTILFYFLESLWRQNWFKYVIRYRRLRDAFHRGEGAGNLSPYDLTDKYGNRPGWWSRLWSNLWDIERFLFCGSLAVGSLLVRAFM